jgi:adenosylcobyric acid synthase
VVMVEPGRALPGETDLVILPGSKATIADLQDFRRNGWDIDLRAHVRRGGRVLGLCGGYQMLGHRVADPDGIEGPPETTLGLSLLDIETTLTQDKTLVEVSGILIADGEPFRGYEMHIGQTVGPDCDRPLLRFSDGRLDGAVSVDGRVRGTYVHGLFAADRARASLLSWFGAKAGVFSFDAEIDRVLDALADHLALDIDLDHLLRLAR